MSERGGDADVTDPTQPSPAPDADVEWLSLEPDEEVHWRGGPRIQTAYPWVGLAAVVVVGVVAGVVATPLSWLALLAVPFVLVVAASGVLQVVRTEYVVTSEAVAARRGVLGVSVTVIDLEHVQNTAASQHALGRAIGYGTIEIDTAGGEATAIQFRNVEDPQSVRRLVDRKRERAEELDTPGSLEEWELVLEEVRRWRLAVEQH